MFYTVGLDSDRNIAVLVAEVHINDDGLHKKRNVVSTLQKLKSKKIFHLGSISPPVKYLVGVVELDAVLGHLITVTFSFLRQLGNSLQFPRLSLLHCINL